MSTSAVMIVGIAAIRMGSAAMSPWASATTIPSAAVMSIGRFAMSVCTICTSTVAIVGMSVGSAAVMPLASATMICMAAAMIAGSIPSSAVTSDMTIGTAADTMPGAAATIPETSPWMRDPARASTCGTILPTSDMSCVRTPVMLSASVPSTGPTFLTTAPKASMTLLVSLPTSAFASPRPATSDDQDAFMRPNAPEIVWVASRSKLPAYCDVLSKNIAMAISDLSAWLAVFHLKLMPFSRAYASIVVAFMATPRLSIMVKLPLAAPATDSIATDMSMPMTDAISAARCIAREVSSSDFCCSMPLPWKRAPILFAVARYSDCESPSALYAPTPLALMVSAYCPNTASAPPRFC